MGEQLEAAVPASVPVVPRAGRGLVRPLDRFRGPAAAVVALLEREAFLVVLFAVYLVGLTYNLPSQVASDTWMTLTYGREIVQHGLPSHDALTVWAHGRTWTDQQWLGQLLFYGAYVLGGIRPALAIHVTALPGSLALAIVAPRRHGGS